mmetsp:Transcript_20647/g.31564  ORF Transcript_20647/g.31564 Transcript_20647/m.31564 type:complete len:255 (-) Transcript_20647:2189-2953(-)
MSNESSFNYLRPRRAVSPVGRSRNYEENEEVTRRLQYLGKEEFWKFNGCSLNENDIRTATSCVKKATLQQWETVGPLLSLPHPKSQPEYIDEEIIHNNNMNKLAEEEEDCCAICLSNNEISRIKLPCGCNAQYHFDCIEKWIKDHKTCPCCREDILNRPLGQNNKNATHLIQHLWTATDLAFQLQKHQHGHFKTETAPTSRNKENDILLPHQSQQRLKTRLSTPDKLRATVARARRRSQQGGERNHLARTSVAY